MFARTLKHLADGVSLATAAVITFVAGAACNGGPDCLCDSSDDHFLAVARGANVIPPAADTLAKANVAIVGFAAFLEYHIVALPSGATTIDSIFLYTIAASAANYTVDGTGTTTYVAPSARVCGSSAGSAAAGIGLVATTPPACAADVALGYQATNVTNANLTHTVNTIAGLTSSMRGFGQQVVFFTSGPNYKRGNIRGTPYPAY